MPFKHDSSLLYDGGLYNNFPWQVLQEDFHPDVLIGSKCTAGNSKPAEDDVVVFYRNPDLAKSLRHRDGRPLDFNLKSERLKMLEYVYRGSPWVDLNSIESEAKALMKTDPTQAERFFGNRLVKGGGAWLEDGLRESCNAGA